MLCGELCQTSFKNANEAFEYLYDHIMDKGIEFDKTKAIFNCGFYIENPEDRYIRSPWRKWKKDYAEREWEWYLSGNPNAEEISKHAKIWLKCMDEKGNVNSNYGYQWKRGDQLEKVINMLKNNVNTRKASISLYDGKEIDLYSKDTICTYAINLTVLNGKINMSVMMRSNDLIYGFCNDQYCFSKLQSLVAERLGLPVGRYHHFVNNLHIYERHYNMKESWYASS